MVAFVQNILLEFDSNVTEIVQVDQIHNTPAVVGVIASKQATSDYLNPW